MWARGCRVAVQQDAGGGPRLMHGACPMGRSPVRPTGHRGDGDVPDGDDVQSHPARSSTTSPKAIDRPLSASHSAFGTSPTAETATSAESRWSPQSTGDCRPSQQRDAVGGEYELHSTFGRGLGDEGAKPAAEQPPKWGITIDDGHVEASVGTGRGNLHAEESGADHEHGARAVQPVGKARRIVEGANDVLAGLPGPCETARERRWR
ncbi:hypothetical protein GCM10010234_67390 [Streptomyces hawaiiensis]